MYRVELAEIKDVDMLLDFKLDIIFNSEEILNMDKNDMEKIVNCCEEEIRENISKYRLVYYNSNIVAAFMVDDYADGKIIDFIYVTAENRQNGICKYILNKIINDNYQPIYAWIYINNEIAINIFKKFDFILEEETDYKILMKNNNVKEENKNIKIKLFERDVEELARKYGVDYTIKSNII